MAMTYTSLFNQVLAYLDRSDASTQAQVPNFIAQAEQRMCRESKNIGFEVYVVSNFIIGQAIYQKPGRWRRNISFNYGTGDAQNTRVQMEIRSYEYTVLYWPDRTQLGAPLYYSDYGYNNFIVCPTPDIAYPFEFSYLELPEPITEENQTNWITNFAPDVLLYATLLEAIPFLKDDERVPIWNEKYQTAMASLNGQDDQRLTDRATNRTSD